MCVACGLHPASCAIAITRAALDLLRAFWSAEHRDLSRAAEQLASAAIKDRFSMDNVSVVLVALNQNFGPVLGAAMPATSSPLPVGLLSVGGGMSAGVSVPLVNLPASSSHALAVQPAHNIQSPFLPAGFSSGASPSSPLARHAGAGSALSGRSGPGARSLF